MHSNEIEQTTLPQKIANKANIFEVAEWAKGEMEFLFLCSGQYLICERSEWVRYRAEHEKRIPYLEETMYYFVYYTNTLLTRKSRDGSVVRALPSTPPTNVPWVQFPDPASYVGWVCSFSTLHQEVFSGYSSFPSPQKPAFDLICVN